METLSLFDLGEPDVAPAPPAVAIPSQPGVCHACGRAVPYGFTDSCRACRIVGATAQSMTG